MAIDNKDKKVLNVPHLRFPEFSGEWEKCKFGDIATGFDYGMNAAAKPFDGENKYIRITDIDEASSTYNDTDIVSPDGTLTDNYVVNDRDILLARTGASTGKSYLYRKSDGKLYYAGFLIRANVTEHNPYFVFSQLHTHRYWRWVSIMSARSGQPGINSQEYSSFPIFTTSLQEENKISTLLSLLDERIATQNKIIEDLKKLKSAISKQAFAQKPNGWNRLDTLFSKGKAGGTPTSTNKEYYNGEIPFLSINDITKQGKYVRYTENHLSRSGLENSSAWVVPEYSLIISMYASVGLVTINEVPITTSQAMFAMRLRDKDLLDYLYYYLSYFKYRHIHKYLETGTQSNINADIVRGIMIPTYGHSRNMKIASTLQSIDAKIDNELSVLKLFNRQKNYLLSQMFI
ncbi:restriction endonuclease subunit S [Parabacteroides sp. Y3-G-102]|uniref:restriction endonuclease subunit S n=1 Tax=Parabacteroides sp. Y3-G-102 TaxID=2949649 RepID=UPI0020307166|nr:restriction endonuclease subunit S [Parabacteroides sp. Y3-G-102]MCM0727346.1 restriction endonuclease subunit S [Parabacteroides sp. Y3-G-102]